jgi:hypothetical protein
VRADVGYGKACVAKRLGGTAGRQNFHTVPRKRAAEFDEAGFVGNGKEGSADADLRHDDSDGR